jgi:HEAT repeat protein
VRLLAPGLVLVFLFVLVSAAPAQDDLPALVRDLGSAEPQPRSAALSALSQRRDPRAIPLLLGAVGGFDLLGRYYVMLVLDAYPPDLSAKAARALVSSEDPYLRVAAGTILLKTGDGRVADLVAKGLRAEGVETQARLYMMYRLHGIDHPKVLGALREFVVKGEEVSLLGQALDLLVVRQDRDTVPRCEKLASEDERPGARAMALAWLYRLGFTARAADLAREIAGGGIDVNEFFRVKNLLWAAQRVDEVILDALVEMLETKKDNVSVLTSAVDLLSKYRHRKAIPLFRELLAHDNRPLAKAAFEALAGIPGALDAALLLPMLEAKDEDRRLWAADALRRRDDGAGLAAVIGILDSGTPNQRQDAAQILGGFRTAAAVAPLLRAMEDEDQTVRMHAGTSLSNVFRALFPYRRLDFATVGFAFNAPAEARAAAVAKIRAWWVAASK